MWVFKSLEVNHYVSWIFLPAFIRIVSVLLFGWAAVIGLIIGAIIINHLSPKLGDLYAPVVVYMIVIATMFSSAIMISSNTNTKRYGVNYFVPGAALFVLSDSVLSLNIFAYKNVFLGVVVMFTYGFAQFFLAKGFRNYLMNK
jgi:uncharacterized membrane protein YhhN